MRPDRTPSHGELSAADEIPSILACPACHQQPKRSRQDGALYCPDCGHVADLADGYVDFLSPAREVIPEDAELDYHWDWRSDPRITPVVAAAWQVLVDAHMDLLLPLLPEGARYVAVGAGGENWYAPALSGRVSDYVVVDASAAQLPITRTPRGARPLLLRALGERLPLASGWADAVELQGVIDHAVDPTAMLAEAQRVVLPGGLVTVTVSNHDSWYRRGAAAVGVAAPHDHAHAHEFGPDTLRRLITAAGLTIVANHTVSYLRLPAAVERALGRILADDRLVRLVKVWDVPLRTLFGANSGGMTVAVARRPRR